MPSLSNPAASPSGAGKRTPNTVLDSTGSVGAKRRASREVPLHQVGTESELAIDVALDTTSPSRMAMDREEEAELNRALGSLPDHYRELILLHHRDGLSFAEISRQVNRSAEAVRKMWLRAVKQLQQYLEGRDGPRGV